MIRKEIKNLIEKVLKDLQKKKKIPNFDIPDVHIEHPENEEFGDYSSNIAMSLAKNVKMKPMELAVLIQGKAARGRESGLFEKVEVKKPGFINFYLSQDVLDRQVAEILKQGDKYGDLKIGKGKKIQVEFISANPTGPVTMGNGRGAFTGDALVKILRKAGYKAESEYYWNDARASAQVVGLGNTIKGIEEVYAGDYVKKLSKKIKKEFGVDVGNLNVDEVGQYAVDILKKENERVIEEKFKVDFDNWFSEQSLYDSGATEKALQELEDKDLLYEKEGAKWFKATEYGDSEDRVVVRSDGTPTYFLPDIAYHLDKYKRGFDKVINIWGADHAGYVKRLKGAMAALGHNGKLEILIAQLVRLMKDGKEAKMSKRAGKFVTLEELIDEVGLDAARFFFLMYALNSHMDFDINLAKKQSQENPVYYVQYAHARISSIFKKADIKFENIKAGEYKKMAELDLIKELIKFPELIEDLSENYEIHRLTYYATDLAKKFHSFYNAHKVISNNNNLMASRLALVKAAKIILKNTLDLMGVKAPDKM